MQLRTTCRRCPVVLHSCLVVCCCLSASCRVLAPHLHACAVFAELPRLKSFSTSSQVPASDQHVCMGVLLSPCKLLGVFFKPPGLAGISDFWVRPGLDLVVFGWFRAPRGRFGPILGLPGAARTDIRPDSTLIRH